MKEIRGYEGLYAVDEYGSVYSLDRVLTGVDGVSYRKKGKKLTPGLNKQTGYWQIDLWRNNKGKKFYVHRLVAEAFIPNPDNKLEINHKDSDRANCIVTNLEWVTSSDNLFHAYQSGNATQIHRRKLKEEDYPAIFNRFMAGETFASILRDFDISPGRLSVNLVSRVRTWGKEAEYLAERHNQRVRRAMRNGAN